MRLLIVYPTRNRKKLFFETLDNIEATIGAKEYEVIVNIDADDLSMNNEETINTIQTNYYNVRVFVNEPISKIAACNANIDKVKNWDWIILMSDDQKFIVSDWYDKMVHDIKSIWKNSFDFFAHFNDGFCGDKLPTMAIMGRMYYNRFGHIYEPSYGSVSVDAEQMWVAMMLGRHHYFPNVYFNHLHPSNLGTPTDTTYAGNDKFGKPDTDNYFNRMKRYFDVPEHERVMIPEQLANEIKNLK